MADDDEINDAFDELIANAKRNNKKRSILNKEDHDEEGDPMLIRYEIFTKKAKAAGYSSLEGRPLLALDEQLKVRLKEFLLKSVINCDCRNNGTQLTEKDALDVIGQTNYFKYDN